MRACWPTFCRTLLVLLGLAGLGGWCARRAAAFSAIWQRVFLQSAGAAELRWLQTSESSFSKEHVNRCQEPRGTRKVYDVVRSLPSTEIEHCGSIAAVEFLPANDEITHVSHRCLSYLCVASQGGVSAEVVLVVRRKGPIYQLDVVTVGDYKHWTVNLPPTREIRGHSCLDDHMFCDVVSVTPLETGFIVLDRHRVLEFKYTWQPDDAETLLSHVGQMNALDTEATYTSLSFPSVAAVYQPFNKTHIDETLEVSPLFPHAGARLILVTDTGNHRVIMLNTSASGQLHFAGQFGVTGEARSNSMGLDSPWGIAVYAPAWESLFRATFANVFVADRRNSRLVKLDLGYTVSFGAVPGSEDTPGLTYSGEYGPSVSGAKHSEVLGEPVGVALYRHYILVAEARGNTITVLMVDHAQTSRFHFVMHLQPARSVQLAGSIAASTLGYVWFSYIDIPNDYRLGSIFLPEPLRWSAKPSRLEDLIRTCQNASWYHHVLRFNYTDYMDHVGFALSAAEVNWIFPSRPGYMDILTFNLTNSFDLDAFNSTVFQGRMVLCKPPPPPSTPSMLSGNENGWNTPGRQSAAEAAAWGQGPAAVCWALLAWTCLPGLRFAE